ncbi:STAGA complex 65 subunit gamma-like [Actinia tenebrosa]|uniref:STAGA complex 65 subunit gamma n=1 Tax=Actinia tenebrosa TaxID=6105 RepID=A0A6P8IVQ0_ACTTE|nr:STAGA complex 65 subunit gamma-like [Actinia tenebrosa]
MDSDMANEPLWGEVEEISSKTPSSLIDAIEMKAVDYELPRLHQPSSENCPPKDELPSEFLPSVKCPLDRHKQNIMLHSIELQYHKRRMRLILMAAQHQQADSAKTDTSEHVHQPLPAHPSKPSRFCASQGIITPPTHSTLISRMHSQPSLHDQPPPLVYPRLDSSSNRQLLLRSVASICAFSGFEMCNEAALESLTDILHDFNTRFCKLLRAAVDDEAMTGGTPFPDVIDGALHEIGIGGISTLQKYWNNNVQEYALRLEKEDDQLIQEYQQLSDPLTRTSFHEDTSSNFPSVKMEEEVEGKYSSSLAFRTMSGSDQNSECSGTSPYGTAVPSNGAATAEVNSDPSSPHWTMHYKTEPVEEGYEDPISVVPATPQPTS